jgi:hypothetical protein
MLKDILFFKKVKICILIWRGLRKGGNKRLLLNGKRHPR